MRLPLLTLAGAEAAHLLPPALQPLLLPHRVLSLQHPLRQPP